MKHGFYLSFPLLLCNPDVREAAFYSNITSLYVSQVHVIYGWVKRLFQVDFILAADQFPLFIVGSYLKGSVDGITVAKDMGECVIGSSERIGNISFSDLRVWQGLQRIRAYVPVFEMLFSDNERYIVVSHMVGHTERS